MSHTRHRHLDSLRGVAAMVVVIVHFMASFLPFVIFGDQPKSASHLPTLEAWFFYPPLGLLVAGQLAVSVFFILSGYVLSLRYLGQPVGLAKTLEMTAKRPIRLGGLVWFSMSLYALFWYFGWFQNTPAATLTGSDLWLSLWWQGELDLKVFFTDLFTQSFSQGTVYNNPLWTIGYELYGSLLVFAFLLLFSAFKYRFLVLLLLVWLFYESMLVGFWLGAIMADIQRRQWLPIDINPRLKQAALAFGGLLFLWLAAYPFYLPAELKAQTIYCWLPSGFSFGLGYPMLAAWLGFTLVLYSRSIQRWLNGRSLHYLGDVSYALYVMHVFVIGTWCSWLMVQLHPLMSYGWAFTWVLLTGIPLCLLLAHWVTRWVDGPAIKLARWLGYQVKQLAERPVLQSPFQWVERHLLRHPQLPASSTPKNHESAPEN
ncbi:acyltransferase family protein [Marinicella meishanensis]|uniref:acyltransferase family protein n=1 Tax=Marinicella meishanensis TaxID=2873263 RepID=UPI001CBDF848|nr:acyltransferase [Marinicella sp. NBU2979]